MTEFARRTAVVTGGDSGMGRELVRYLRLTTPSSLSVRRLPSATAERPFVTARRTVRIRFPPAASPQTSGVLTRPK
jgi:hypothetical protein